MVRKSKGRQKIEMVKMNNESNLQVTFSKRRSGLFKKASELCTLCGAEVAIIVFSPGRKVFSFGHPCVETIIDRFINRSPPSHQQNNTTMQLIEAHRSATVRDLNNQLTQVLNQLEMEKKKGEILSRLRKENKMKNQVWWESPVEELNMTQLSHLKNALDDLKKNVATQASKLLQSTVPPPSYYIGNSSNNIVGGSGLDLFDQRRAQSTTRMNTNIIQNATSYGYNNNNNQGLKQEQSSSSYDPHFNHVHGPNFGSGCPY